jgi:hypothetical protein
MTEHHWALTVTQANTNTLCEHVDINHCLHNNTPLTANSIINIVVGTSITIWQYHMIATRVGGRYNPGYVRCERRQCCQHVGPDGNILVSFLKKLKNTNNGQNENPHNGGFHFSHQPFLSTFQKTGNKSLILLPEF